MGDSRTAAFIRSWKKSGMREDCAFFIKRMDTYGIGVCTDGTFVLIEGLIPIHRNHLRCYLRRDYLEAGRMLSGKALDLSIGYFLDTVPRAYGILHSKDNTNIGVTPVRVKPYFFQSDMELGNDDTRGGVNDARV